MAVLSPTHKAGYFWGGQNGLLQGGGGWFAIIHKGDLKSPAIWKMSDQCSHFFFIEWF